MKQTLHMRARIKTSDIVLGCLSLSSNDRIPLSCRDWSSFVFGCIATDIFMEFEKCEKCEKCEKH